MSESKLCVGDEVSHIETNETGIVVRIIEDDGEQDCYVCFTGINGVPSKGKPYVLRYYSTSLKKIEPKSYFKFVVYGSEDEMEGGECGNQTYLIEATEHNLEQAKKWYHLARKLAADEVHEDGEYFSYKFAMCYKDEFLTEHEAKALHDHSLGFMKLSGSFTCPDFESIFDMEDAFEGGGIYTMIKK